MPTKTILALDPAMGNVGWMFLKLNTEVPLREPHPLPTPEWITEKDTTGVHTYHNFDRLDGGTLQQDPTKPWIYRVQSQAEDVHKLIHRFKPDILALESQLDKGDNKSPTGIALQYLIVAPYYNQESKMFKRYVSLVSGAVTGRSVDGKLPTVEVGLIPEHIPSFVIGIRPEGLQSVAHYERATKGSRVVSRYKQLVPTDKHRLSQHEADAFFIGVHAGRFWATCLATHWPRTHLTTKEAHCFIDPPNSMFYRKEDAWWENTNYLVQNPSVPVTPSES